MKSVRARLRVQHDKDLRTIACGKVKDCVLAGEDRLSHPFGRSFDTEGALNTELQAKAMNLQQFVLSRCSLLPCIVNSEMLVYLISR